MDPGQVDPEFARFRQKKITELGRGAPVIKSVANSSAFLQTDKNPKSVKMYLDLPQYGVVTQYTTVWDDMMERTLKPLGINPPKKKDPIKERYQIQG